MSVVKQIRVPRADYLALEEPALLRAFELLATAEGGVEKLRELILALAVQGRLVPQNSSDEPASSSLMRIRTAKEQRIASEKTKRRATMNHKANVEPTTELPDGWEWAHLSELVTVLNGRAYAKQELLEAGTPVLRVGNLFTSKHWYYSNLQLEDDKYCDAGDLLFAWSASFGPFIWAGPKVIYHYHIWKLALHSETDFYKNYLYTFLLKKTQEMKASGHGVSMLHITKEAMEKIAVPVPPLAEQHRIVARVEELMALCDELEARGRLADEQHARLTTALFDALTASDSAQTLAANWQRIATHFDLLLDRPQAIDSLEQTILQLAVRGLLVPQDASDEPASKLLTRIRVEKNRPVTEGKIRRGKPRQGMTEAALLTDIPSSWEWVRLGDVIELISGQHLTPNEYSEQPDSGIPYLTGPAEFGPASPNPTRWTTTRRAVAKHGDILITVKGAGVGKLNVVDQPELAISRQLMAIRPSRLLPAFAFLFLKTMHDAFQAKAVGIAIPGIGRDDVLNTALAIPPLAEQHRIVARVEHLRRLCSGLRERLNRSRSTQAHLAESLVTDAVQPQRGIRLG